VSESEEVGIRLREWIGYIESDDNKLDSACGTVQLINWTVQ
jgi:hypothetical protein